MPETKSPLYHGKIIDLNIETVTLPNGHQFELEVIRHPGGSAIVAIDADNRVCLIRQYRHIANGWLWELPAGKRHDGEDPLLTAKRELEEETGIVGGEWQALGNFYSSPGVFSEVIHLFLVHHFAIKNHQHEIEEQIEIHWIDFDQAVQWAVDGIICDAKSIIGLLRVKQLLEV